MPPKQYFYNSMTKDDFNQMIFAFMLTGALVLCTISYDILEHPTLVIFKWFEYFIVGLFAFLTLGTTYDWLRLRCSCKRRKVHET